MRGCLLALGLAAVVAAPARLPARALDPNSLTAPIRELREPSHGDLDALRERRLIRVLVSHSPGRFYFDRGVLRGFEAELMAHYGKFLNDGAAEADRVRVAFIPVPFERLIPELLAGHGDVVASNMAVTAERDERVDFSAPYLVDVDEIVVAHADAAGGLESLDDLAGRTVYVTRGSSFAEHLAALGAGQRKRGLEPVTVVAVDEALGVDDLIELLSTGALPLTVADDHEAMRWAELLPDVVPLPALAIRSGSDIALAVRPGSPQLLASLNRYLASARRGTLLGNVLFKRYYRNTNWISAPRGEEVAALEGLFRRYADEYGFDWLGILAQAHQESGLDHSRVSAAGAVGIMQIKPATAADPNVGVPDVHRLEDNIHAGVKYLAFLRDRYFSDPAIGEADRFYFSLAAYNMGPARVSQLRERAAAQGLDGNRWFDHVEVVALERIGREPTRYVSNVTKYYAAYEMLHRQLENRRSQRVQYEGGEARP